MIDYVRILEVYFANNKWAAFEGCSYEEIEWSDKASKPSKDLLDNYSKSIEVDYIKVLLRSNIKQEAKRRIIELYSDVQQRNIIMSQVEADITAMNTAIKAIRDKSNELEASLSDMTIGQLEDFVPEQDSNWSKDS